LLQIRKFAIDITGVNHTLHSQLKRYFTEKDGGMSTNGNDVVEHGRINSLLRMYAKKDTVEQVTSDIEQLKYDMKSLLDQRNRLEIVGNRNTYSNDVFNQTLQGVKQVSNIYYTYSRGVIM